MIKVLLLLDETWNDKKHPNNNMTNWFTNFSNVEIWTISGGEGLPCNNCCKHYFQVSDKAMVRSLITPKKAGVVLRFEEYPTQEVDMYSRGEKLIYQNRKKFSFPLMRLMRSILWRLGRYDMNKLSSFIEDCNPDIIFSQRMGSVKMCRLENIVQQIAKVPIIAYTGDDEYSLRRFQLSISSWINLFWRRAWLKKMIPQYSIFYSQSKTQMLEFSKKFGVRTKFLVKCGGFKRENIHLTVNEPIQLVYAGKLYCNRWKTLKLLAECLRIVNKDGVKMILSIYTKDSCNKAMRKALHDDQSSFLRGAVAGDKLKKIYEGSDIALHVESFDLKNRLATKYSFSTKVMDCLSSGCAVMAICDKRHAAFEYLRENDIAFTASSKEELIKVLNGIVEDRQTITNYAEKAYLFGVEHHDRELVQKNLMKDFLDIVKAD